MALKVLLYSHAFAPKIGGVETHVMLLAQGLACRFGRSGTRDLQVTVVTPVPADGMNDKSLPFCIVREPGFTTLLRLIWSADLIHLAGPSFLPMLTAFLLHKLFTIGHHGYPPICPNGLLVYEPDKTVCSGHFMAGRYDLCLRCNAVNEGWLKSAFKLLLTFPRRWLAKRAYANICVTNHVKDRLALPRANVVYHGIVEFVSPSTAEGECLSASPPCFAYVGRLVSLKGLPLLVEAAQHLKGQGYVFCLKFIGDGPERVSLEKLVDDRGLHTQTKFLGSAQDLALENLMHEVDAVVMPSVWEETAGLAVIEQMMRGKLVIAADIGGLAEVVGEAGLLFRAGDARALAACMKRVLDSPDLARRMGTKARQRALSVFELDKMVDSHLSQWFNVAALRTARGPAPS